MHPYDRNFYQEIREGSRRSASEVVPYVLGFVNARSVVDVGAGTGTWLAEFHARGIEDILGIDPYPPNELLEIPQDRFYRHDLTQPLRLERRFDLVVSLELAEHLPPDAAATLVETLTGLGPVVLFSAAVPYQGGDGHLNEQWPEYWVEKFQHRGYSVVDCLRERLWKNQKVEWWYVQNLFFFVSDEGFGANPRLCDARAQTRLDRLALIHPRSILSMVNRAHFGILDIVRLVPSTVSRAVRQRWSLLRRR